MTVYCFVVFKLVTLSPVKTVNRKSTVNHHCCQQVNFRREIKLVCRDGLYLAIISVVLLGLDMLGK